MWKNVMLLMVVLAIGGLGSANGQMTISQVRQQTVPDEAKELTPIAVYERFRSLAKHQDWSSTYDMLYESYKPTAEAELRGLLSIFVAEPAKEKSFKKMNGPELLSYLLEYSEGANFDRPIVVDETIIDDHATVRLVVAGNRDLQLQDVKLIKRDRGWKFTQMWTVQNPLEQSAEPTISATSIYKAFLVYRQRKDWEAMYCMFEEDSRNRMVSGLKSELMESATTADARENIDKMDGMTLFAKLWNLGSTSGQVNPIKILSEVVNGKEATLTIDTLKDGEWVESKISLIWKGGVWRVLFDF